MRKIIVADSQGFCIGVRKALEIVERYEKVYIFGDLIHNKQVVQNLEKKNKKVINQITGQEDAPVVITAHGTRTENLAKINALGLEIVDTTCPLVSAIYKEGKRLQGKGYHIVIIGDKKHIEVQGIASRMKSPIIVNTEQEVESTQFPQKIGIICQSTFSKKKFDQIVALIKKKSNNVYVRNTICAPTLKRQIAAENLAQGVDLMIVIGGYHSSNTKKLAELARKHVETYHIETADELDKKWLIGKETIGITAGASTPDWVIEAVRKMIASF